MLRSDAEVAADDGRITGIFRPSSNTVGTDRRPAVWRRPKLKLASFGPLMRMMNKIAVSFAGGPGSLWHRRGSAVQARGADMHLPRQPAPQNSIAEGHMASGSAFQVLAGRSVAASRIIALCSANTAVRVIRAASAPTLPRDAESCAHHSSSRWLARRRPRGGYRRGYRAVRHRRAASAATYEWKRSTPAQRAFRQGSAAHPSPHQGQRRSCQHHA